MTMMMDILELAIVGFGFAITEVVTNADSPGHSSLARAGTAGNGKTT